jgi:DNA replicative helicase MCM subunit Mcm2 (Cdc46/Mcm family)
MKQILTVSMFSTCEEPVHTLIIDDPGSVKTFAMDLISRNFNGDTTTIGANSTRAGLICNFATGELGALAYSDKKMVLLDELDKISKKEYPYMYELLWSGKTTVHAGNVHDTIKSHFIMIACANPKHGSFKGVPLREIGLPSPLISRFAFVIKTSPLRKEEMQELFYKKIHSSDFKKLPEYYNQWIKLARFHNPEWKVSEEKEKKYINDVIERIVARYKNSELRRDIRMADYIKRIPMAIARANFSDVTDEIIDKSFDLIIKSIESWS